jgi:hypothetical protein
VSFPISEANLIRETDARAALILAYKMVDFDRIEAEEQWACAPRDASAEARMSIGSSAGGAQNGGVKSPGKMSKKPSFRDKDTGGNKESGASMSNSKNGGGKEGSSRMRYASNRVHNSVQAVKQEGVDARSGQHFLSPNGKNAAPLVLANEAANDGGGGAKPGSTQASIKKASVKSFMAPGPANGMPSPSAARAVGSPVNAFSSFKAKHQAAEGSAPHSSAKGPRFADDFAANFRSSVGAEMVRDSTREDADRLFRWEAVRNLFDVDRAPHYLGNMESRNSSFSIGNNSNSNLHSRGSSGNLAADLAGALGVTSSVESYVQWVGGRYGTSGEKHASEHQVHERDLGGSDDGAAPERLSEIEKHGLKQSLKMVQDGWVNISMGSSQIVSSQLYSLQVCVHVCFW